MSHIERWNGTTAEEAAADVLPCCGSRGWAHGLAALRPLSTLPELLAASDSTWWSLDKEDWREAFKTHPRIGERHAAGTATQAALTWSGAEQSTAMQSHDDVRAKIANGNREYEQKFGRTFIVCATGKGAEEILAILERRMHNTAEAELQEAAEQQREITHIRLREWLSEREALQTS